MWAQRRHSERSLWAGARADSTYADEAAEVSRTSVVRLCVAIRDIGTAINCDDALL